MSALISASEAICKAIPYISPQALKNSAKGDEYWELFNHLVVAQHKILLVLSEEFAIEPKSKKEQ